MNYARVDLHCHLDGSINIRWGYEKALQRKVISPDCSYEDFYYMLFAKNGLHSEESIKKFDLTCDLMQTYDDLFEATYDLGKRQYEMGLYYAEIRYASQHHTKKGLTQLETIKAVCDGANKVMQDYDIKLGIINCLMHKGDSEAYNHDTNIEAIEASKKMINEGLVGLDLAGYENNCDFKDYGKLFELARSYNIPYTIHAGEMGIAEHVNEALDMMPNRIGHGINCVLDDNILNRVVNCQIPLEVCVTCNVKTNLDYISHPIRKLIEKGAYVTINTDNMMFARTDLINEHHQLKMLGISDEQLKQFTINGINASFADDNTKKYILEKLKKADRL